MDYTQNLHLPQWEKTDRIMMDDFNDAMSKLDAAVPRIVTGTYTGTGTYGSGNPNTLTFDFAPKAIILAQEYASNSYGYMLILRGQTHCCSTGSNGGANSCICSFSGNSVSWYCTDNSNGAGYQFNYNGTKYMYLALG